MGAAQLAKARKREAVTVSFHYLARERDAGDGVKEQWGFTSDEFAALGDRLAGLTPMDLTSEQVKDAVRFKRAVPIENVQKINTRTVFAGYRAAYWGHAYENTAVGKVPADSISLRPFYFILYHGKDERIYLGVQYLGLFGSYEGLKNTLISFMSDPKSIVPHSFRQDSAIFEDVEPSEVRVKVIRKPTDIASEGTITDEAIVTFKKGRKDANFADRVKQKLLPVMGTNAAAVKKAASDIVRDSGLFDVSDNDVADCTVVGKVNGHTKTVYMISQGLFATPFHINPTFNLDGHPDADPTKAKMIEVLKSRVISAISDA